jgi:hypothetical protein
MSDDPGGCSGVETWIRESRLYGHCERVRHEIDLHKWYESERAGHDIGWDRAAVDWMIRFGGRRTERE